MRTMSLRDFQQRGVASLPAGRCRRSPPAVRPKRSVLPDSGHRSGRGLTVRGPAPSPCHPEHPPDPAQGQGSRPGPADHGGHRGRDPLGPRRAQDPESPPVNHGLVLDTNILVSAGIYLDSPPGLLVQSVLLREVALFTCPGIVAEYWDVLTRKKFARLDFPPPWFKPLLEEAHFKPEDPAPWPLPGPDPDDLIFLSLAHRTGAVLVSGNLADFPQDIRRGVPGRGAQGVPGRALVLLGRPCPNLGAGDGRGSSHSSRKSHSSLSSRAKARMGRRARVPGAPTQSIAGPAGTGMERMPGMEEMEAFDSLRFPIRRTPAPAPGPDP